MPTFRKARVAELVGSRRGLQRVLLDNGDAAYVLTQVVAEVAVGDEVVVNTTAVELGLGTGGSHVVHTNLSRSETSVLGSGHIMKARYLSEQLDAGAWEEHEPPLAFPDGELPSLAGVRVVLCVLHSHVAALAAGVRHLDRPAPGYVMTDQAALPLALSDSVYELRERDLLVAAVSAGQAFGGDLEAVNVASGVDALARRGHTTVIIAAGPGHVGTASPIGFSALELAGHAAVLGRLGAEVAFAVRASSVDERQRHLGISHHAVTLLDATPPSVGVPIPTKRAPEPVRPIDHSWITDRGHSPCRHVPVDLRAAFSELDLDIATMGRRLADDDLAMDYLGAAAAWLADGDG